MGKISSYDNSAAISIGDVLIGVQSGVNKKFTAIGFIPDQTDFLESMFIGDGGHNILHTIGNDGRYNTVVGIGAGLALTTACINTLVGQGAGNKITTGNLNAAFGQDALYSNITGEQNTAIGNSAMGFAKGNNNVAIGTGTLHMAAGDDAASDNVIIGWYSGNRLKTGSNANTFIGQFTGYAAATLVSCIFIGKSAGQLETNSYRFIVNSNEGVDATNAILYGIIDGTIANQYLRINAVLGLPLLASAPAGNLVEGNIYCGTDHHIYYYNGSTWKQLDN